MTLTRWIIQSVYGRSELTSISQPISLAAIGCAALLGGLVSNNTHANAANIPISDCVTGAAVSIDSSVTIRKISIDNQNIFDLDNPDENNFLFKTPPNCISRLAKMSSGEKTRWLLDGNLSGRWESAEGLL